jgi:hypothetical protein
MAGLFEAEYQKGAGLVLELEHNMGYYYYAPLLDLHCQ